MSHHELYVRSVMADRLRDAGVPAGSIPVMRPLPSESDAVRSGERPSLSILVVNFNSTPLLRGCLDAIADLFEPGGTPEVDLAHEIIPRARLQSDTCVNKITVHPLRNSAVGAEEAQNLVDPQPFRCRSQTSRRSIAAPLIVFGRGDHTRTDRIQNDVAQDVQHVRLFLDHRRIGTTLQEISNPVVSFVEVLRILSIQPLHPTRQRRARELDEDGAPAPIIRDVFADGEGTITAIDTRGVGMAVVASTSCSWEMSYLCCRSFSE